MLQTVIHAIIIIDREHQRIGWGDYEVCGDIGDRVVALQRIACGNDGVVEGIHSFVCE